MEHNDVTGESSEPSDPQATVLTFELTWTVRPRGHALSVGKLLPPSAVRMCVRIVVGHEVRMPAMHYQGPVRRFILEGVDGLDSTAAERLLSLLIHTAESNFAHHLGRYQRPPTARLRLTVEHGGTILAERETDLP